MGNSADIHLIEYINEVPIVGFLVSFNKHNWTSIIVRFDLADRSADRVRVKNNLPGSDLVSEISDLPG